MSGSTILESIRAIHQMQQETKKREADPKYAEACNKIDPIIEKHRNSASRIVKYAMLGGLVTGAIVGAATGYSLGTYIPENFQTGSMKIGECPIFYFTGFAAFIGEIVGGVVGSLKESKLKRMAKKEIDSLGLEYTVDEDCF